MKQDEDKYVIVKLLYSLALIVFLSIVTIGWRLAAGAIIALAILSFVAKKLSITIGTLTYRMFVICLVLFIPCMAAYSLFAELEYMGSIEIICGAIGLFIVFGVLFNRNS